MASLTQGVERRGVSLGSIIQRDLDRQRFAARQAARRTKADKRAHKNGYGTFSGARVA